MKTPGVLIVAYHFPPMGGSGVQRALKLARYLPSNGWRVHVLTSDHQHYPLCDATMLDELDGDVAIHRVRGLEPGALAATLAGFTTKRSEAPGRIEDSLYWRLDRFCDKLPLVEPESLWVRAATRAAKRIIRQHDIDVVITTSPPHSTQRIGRKLQDSLGVRWAADLRDPILDNFGYSPASPRIHRHWTKVESQIVREADRIIVTCPELKERLLAKHGAQSAPRFEVVTNGYDPSDAPVERPCRNNADERFVLCHVGAFYRAQSLAPLLDAVRRFLSRRPDWASRFELRLVGSISAAERPLLRLEDEAFARTIGYLPHHEAISEMADADALFLMTPTNANGRNCIPAKLFEYMAFGGHIIGLIHDGASVAQILGEAGDATLIPHGDTARLADAIECVCDAKMRGERNSTRRQNVVERYRRDVIASRYAQILRKCLPEASETALATSLDADAMEGAA